MRLLSMAFAGAVVLVACSTHVSAQGQVNQNSNGTVTSVGNPNVSLKSMSLLDPDRFTMRQESIFSYSSSNMSGSNLLGMYINTMEYRFNMPLTMRLKVAYQNDMGSLIGSRSMTGGRQGVETGRLFIPAFDIIYQPWENTSISFHFRDFSGMTTSNPYGMYSGYSPFTRHYDPYGLYR
ncbi:hypothetical protein ACFL55_01860 [Candidatus Latescibacterota bacterium]